MWCNAMWCYVMYCFKKKRCGKGKKLEVSWILFYLIAFLSFSRSRLRWQIEAVATSHGSVAWCRLDLECRKVTWIAGVHAKKTSYTQSGWLVSYQTLFIDSLQVDSSLFFESKTRDYSNSQHGGCPGPYGSYGNPWHISPRDVGSLVMPQAPWAPWAPCPRDAARIPRRPRAARAVPTICRWRHRGVPVLIVLGHDNHDP